MIMPCNLRHCEAKGRGHTNDANQEWKQKTTAMRDRNIFEHSQTIAIKCQMEQAAAVDKPTSGRSQRYHDERYGKHGHIDIMMHTN